MYTMHSIDVCNTENIYNIEHNYGLHTIYSFISGIACHVAHIGTGFDNKL